MVGPEIVILPILSGKLEYAISVNGSSCIFPIILSSGTTVGQQCSSDI